MIEGANAQHIALHNAVILNLQGTYKQYFLIRYLLKQSIQQPGKNFETLPSTKFIS